MALIFAELRATDRCDPGCACPLHIGRLSARGRPMRKHFLAVVFVGTVAAAALSAQSTSSVYSPDVVKGRHAVEYRAAFDAETDNFSHRIHYQYGFTESLRGRIILEQDKPEGEDLDFQFVRLEVLWQFLEDQEAGCVLKASSATATIRPVASGLAGRTKSTWTTTGSCAAF
ncbi:MAG: hypothetical protein ACFB20_11545 [Opitutales bacterium]